MRIGCGPGRATLFALSAAACLNVTLGAASSTPPTGTAHRETCAVELIVLGTGQDAGAPQIGVQDDPARADPSLELFATSIGLVDRRTGARFLFEATPDIGKQLEAFGDAAPAAASPAGGALGIDGVFLTHAHIGHYAGLMFFGREAAGAAGVRVHASPRLKAFLETNGPWDQLVSLQNIKLEPMLDGTATTIGDRLKVRPQLAPHRDEYSDTVGFWIEGPDASAFFLPDIDDWDAWRDDFSVEVADVVRKANVVFLDATFFDDGELDGRDMSEIPHPRVVETMARLSGLSARDRAKVRFIHYNHTNPIRFAGSPQSVAVMAAGFGIARRGDRFCLAVAGR